MSKRYRDRWDPTPEDVERRAMRYGWKDGRAMIHGWPEAIYRAYHYDGTKLSAYLRQIAKGELDPLDQAQLNELAKLIDQCVHRRLGKSGRKPGSIPPRDPDAITADYFAALARGEVDSMKRANGGRTPREAMPKAINTVAQWLGVEGGHSLKHIDMNQVLAMMKRGKPRRDRRN